LALYIAHLCLLDYRDILIALAGYEQVADLVTNGVVGGK
jgi:hypothetical protein